MTQPVSISERVYGLIKRAALNGLLDPYARLDFAEIAAALEVSTTPVREAVMRLLGEGLFEPHPRGGVRVTLVTEARLRALLDLNAHLALLGLDWVGRPFPQATAALPSGNEPARVIFGSLARATSNDPFALLVEQVSDRLAPVRRIETALWHDQETESAALAAAFCQSIGAAKRAVRRYHHRRLAAAAQLASLTLQDVDRDAATVLRDRYDAG